MRITAFILLILMMGIGGAIAQNAPAAPTPPAAPATPAAAANTAPSATPAAGKPADTKKTSEPPKATATPAKPADATKAPTAPQKSADNKNGDKGSGNGDKKPAAQSDTADTAAALDKNKKTAKADAAPCVVAEFRAIGMDTQDPAKRRAQATNWLKRHAKQCSVEQLLMIRNNRSQWMGTADSAALAVTVDSLLEAIAADNPQVAAILYGTPPAPPSEDGGSPGK